MKHIFSLILALLLGVPSLRGQQETDDYEHRPFQFTFLFPPLSTNGVHNASIVNNVSLNLLVGLSGGVESFEAGGLINIDRYDVSGFQVAGFGNTVGGYVKGAQMAGFYNVNGASVTGFQGAGFLNVAGNEVKGAQVSGFVNVSGGTLNGFQGTGFVNVTGASGKGVQAAGFGNVSGSGSTHFQGSGFFNVAREVNGAQVAGFINVAHHVKGVQVAGFINICDSIDGVPIGLINVVRMNGYRNFGFSVSEVQYINFSYHLGVKELYTIYSFGKPFGPWSRWMFGGGLGTRIDLKDRTMLQIEGTVHQELWIGNPVNPYFLYIDRLNLYNTLRFMFGWEVQEHLSLHIGPTFNVSVAYSNPDTGALPWHQIPPYSILNHTSGNAHQTNVQMWFGLQGSIRF
jgi:hypothetical protein